MAELKLQHIDHVAITVRDVQRSREWYTSVLGLEHRPVDQWGGVPTMVCAGDTCVALFPSSVEDPQTVDGRATVTMRHFASTSTILMDIRSR